MFTILRLIKKSFFNPLIRRFFHFLLFYSLVAIFSLLLESHSLFTLYVAFPAFSRFAFWGNFVFGLFSLFSCSANQTETLPQLYKFEGVAEGEEMAITVNTLSPPLQPPVAPRWPPPPDGPWAH